MLLPQKIGPLTLMRKLGSDGVSEAFVGILDEPAGQHVVVRRLLPFIARDPARLAAVESRIQDLTAVRHPTLVPVQRLEQVDDHRLVIEDRIDAVSLGDVIAWCRKEGRSLPHNVFLNLATQICNGLEALHGRPGKSSGEEHVLHLMLGPDAVLVTPEARLLVGEYGLVRSPTSLPSSGGAEAAARRLAHISPEQTHPDQKLSPASDIFSLGSLLYELLMLEPLFRRDSSLQTIHAVRKAEVSGALQRIKKVLPGLDKVLYRALSLNPRHRYQRAFVLREDVRGLMAGYSFTRINEETAAFLAPLFEARARARPDTAQGASTDSLDTTASLLRDVTDVPSDTPRPQASRPGGDTLASFADSDGEDDELEGLEMWSEVPTTVDPTDPSATPVATASPDSADASGVPLDQTHWIRRDHTPDAPDKADAAATDEGPSATGFEGDEATDVAADPSRPGSEGGDKRQLSPEELEAMGMSVRRTPAPAGRTESKGAVAPPPPPAPRRPSTDDAAAATEDDVLATDASTTDSSGTDASGADSSGTERAAATAAGASAASPPPQKSMVSSKSEYRPPGASTPKPAPAASDTKGPKLEGRKLEGLKFDEDEVTAITDDEGEDFDDLDYKPRRSGRGLAIAGAFLGVFVIVLVCGGVAVLAGQGVVAGLLGSPTVASNDPAASPAPDPALSTPAASPPSAPDADPTTPGDSATGADGGDPAPAIAEAPATEDPVEAPVAAAPRPIASGTADPEPVRSPRPIRDPSTDRSGTPSPSPTRRPPTATTASLSPTSSPAPSPTPAPRAVDPTPPRPSATQDGGLVEAVPADTVIENTSPDDLATLATRARSGRLSAADRLTLEMTEKSDLSYTRANAILYEDAKARGDESAQRKYLGSLLEQPENKYNPTFLAEGAHLDIADRNYERALSRANTAERFWARLPSELVFSRKAMIYEAQAASWQGKFYQSGGSDMVALGNAIRAWEKYQRHAATRSRTDLSRIADDQLAKLYDARRRLE